MAMDNNNLENSPLTNELYSIDWAVRFDEYRKYDESSYVDLHQLLTKVETLVDREFSPEHGDLNDIKVLTSLYKKAKAGSVQWHRLSMLIHVRIILSSIPKGLTATATLSAIQVMEHMWKVLELSENEPDKDQSETGLASKKQSPSAKKPAVKAAPPPPQVKSARATSTQAKPVTKNTENKKVSDKTENVVIKKLATEAGLEDDKMLASRCYEVASSLADEYPEYTLTAIRVMTAEKLGVTRQFIENLDIKPARFKNG